MSDSDTWAFAVLSEYFKMRLRKLHTFKKQQSQTISAKAKKTKGSNSNSGSAGPEDQFQLQSRTKNRGKVYRCLKASAIAYLTKIELLESIKKVPKTDSALTKD